MTRIVTVISLLAFCWCLAMPLAAGAAAVANVNGAAISQEDFDRQRKPFLQKLGIPNDHADKSGKVNQFKKDLMERLIAFELLSQEAGKKGMAPTDAQVDEEFTKVRGRFPNAEAFASTLTAQGWTEEILRQSIRRTLGVQKLVADEIASKVTVTDAEVHEFYAGNQEAFKNEETAHARHILVSPDAAALAAADAAGLDRPRRRRGHPGRGHQEGRGDADGGQGRGADEGRGAAGQAQGRGRLRRPGQGELRLPLQGAGRGPGHLPPGRHGQGLRGPAFARSQGSCPGRRETSSASTSASSDDPASVTPVAEASERIREYLKGQKVNAQIEEHTKQLRAAAKSTPPAAY